MANVIYLSAIAGLAWRARWLAACLMITTLMDFHLTNAHGAPGPGEATLKAAYLVKFGNFIEWPQRAFTHSNSFIIGILGADGLAEELEHIADSGAVNGRPVAVRRLRIGDPLAGINVLFIGRSHNGQLAEILAATKGEPILTVTEAEKGLALGSIINFIVVNGRLRFEVAPRTAEQRKLVISARLLVAAYKVEAGT
jgi:hypothetical protein